MLAIPLHLRDGPEKTGDMISRDNRSVLRLCRDVPLGVSVAQSSPYCEVGVHTTPILG